MSLLGGSGCASAPQESAYVVDNNELRSSSSGIRYRFSPDMDDTDHRPGFGIAKFGDIVQGVPFPEGVRALWHCAVRSRRLVFGGRPHAASR